MILDEIVKATKKRYENKLKDIDTIKNQALSLNKLDNRFYKNLDKDEFNFIFEVKKASPSKGIISENFDYINQAKNYQLCGACAISVLTEPDFFLGSDEYLKDIRKIVDIPILRKDFIIYEYQIYEARLIGADAILLIASILDEYKLKDFINIATTLGLDYIVEVHNKEELDIALNIGAKIIGINNRNLADFSVDINNSIYLNGYVKNKNIKIISESGIKTINDLLKIKMSGIRNFLIGEAVMRLGGK